MINFLCFNISLVRLFWRIKIPYVFSFSVDHYGSSPFFGLLRFCNSFCRSVLAIFGLGNNSQINKPVIRFDAVNVINYPTMNFSVAKKPSHPMCIVQLTVNSKNYVPISIGCSNWFCNVYDGKKQTCVWVVANVFKIVFVHAVAPICNGLKSDGSVLTHRAVAPL